ncbi:hypothetical protein Agub_g1935 [Astrephomene gubernaculifera]|uniref:Uncharacterized protein n=1 Tax=Astrephomene gubernaculifera TaxID=47775 RepID=A0AAD3DGA1_9CHLO|nr:hypothetical protein Agub_g1935 [Astrephomene gubernaculifera]
MDGKARPREKLDVPNVAPFEQKLANLTRQRPAIGPAPRSSVLDKLAAFLPQLAHENERLQEQMQSRPATDFDIEHIEGEKTATYIEMDLACGVLELRDEAALRAAEAAMEGRRGGLGMSEDGSSSDSSSEEDEEEEEDSSEGSEEGVVEPSNSSGGQEERRARKGEGLGGGDRGGDPGRNGQEVVEMECDAGEAEGRSGQGAQGSGTGAAVVRPGAGKGAGRRRKLAAKRNKMIEELP